MPGFIDPYKLAKHGQSLQGKVPVAAMQRALASLASDQGEIEYNLSFATDEDGLCVISGEFTGQVTMRCERCLKNYIADIGGEFTVSPVADEAAAKQLDDSYEPVIAVDGKLYPSDLIEDELILALPIMPLHKAGDQSCIEFIAEVGGAKPQSAANPFQILQTLKVNVKKEGQQAEDI